MTLPAYNSGQSISLNQIRNEFGASSSIVQVWEPSASSHYYSPGVYHWYQLGNTWPYADSPSFQLTAQLVWAGVVIGSPGGTSYTSNGYTYVRGVFQGTVQIGTTTLFSNSPVIRAQYSVNRYYFQQTSSPDSNPINFSQYYAGGGSGYVPSGTVGFPKPSGTPTSIPTSGQISFNNFYGSTKRQILNLNIDSPTYNFDVRAAAVASGWNQSTVLDVRVNIAPYSAGIVMGSSPGDYALVVSSSWPSGTLITINNQGWIVGAGGTGGAAGNAINLVAGSGGAGGQGGPALLIQYPTTINNTGMITGGGGGGGGGGATVGYYTDTKSNIFYAGAGGGAGGGGYAVSFGDFANYGTPGSVGVASGNGSDAPNSVYSNYPYGPHPGADFAGIVTGGSGGQGGGIGSGGNAGSAGGGGYGFITSVGSGGAGGSPGYYIVGNSNVTWTSFGTRYGLAA